MILSICDVPEVLKLIHLIKVLIKIIKIAVPIMLIISIMIDLFKNVVSADDLSKTGNIIVKKIFAAVLVFLIPTFVGMIFSIIGATASYKPCFDMATSQNYTEKYDQHMLVLMKEARTNPSLETYGAASDYLSNIKDSTLKNKYKNELDIIKQQLDDNSRETIGYSDGNGGTGTGNSNGGNGSSGSGSGSGSSSSQAPSNKDFLATAKEIWREILFGDRHFSYDHGAHIPPKGSTIDCSSYVDWVLCEYGYKDFCGKQIKSKTWFKTNWSKKYGWEEISFKADENITSYLRPGDIVVRHRPKHGHILIVVKKGKNNVFRVYDCGRGMIFRHGGRGPTRLGKTGDFKNGGYQRSFFVDNYGPGKIIRVTPPKN